MENPFQHPFAGQFGQQPGMPGQPQEQEYKPRHVPTISKQDRLSQFISVCGDQGPSVYQRDCKKLYDIIMEVISEKDEEAKQIIMKYFVNSVAYLPSKTSVYATIFCLLYQKIPEPIENMIHQLKIKLQQELDLGDLLTPRCILQFYCELVNIGVLNNLVILSLLFDLLGEAERTMKKESKDYYLYIAVSVLPYTLPHLMESSQLECKNLMGNLKELMGQRDLRYLNILQPFQNKNFGDNLSRLWQGLYKAYEEGKLELQGLHKAQSNFKDDLTNMKQIKFDIKLQFGKKDKLRCVYQSPVFFEIFERKEIVPTDIPNDLEKVILSNQFIDLLTLFRYKKHLVLKQIFQYQSKFNFNKVLIETIFGELLKLPQAQSREIYFASLFGTFVVEENDASMNSLKALIQNGFNILFSKCSFLDVECESRVIECFSSYIANVGFQFHWDQIESEIAVMKPTDHKVIFVKRLLAKITNQYFRNELKKLLPAKLQELITSEPEPVISYQHSNEYRQIQVEITNKKSDEEMSNFIRAKMQQNKETEIPNIFLQCVIEKSSKSLTHMNTFFNRYFNTLQGLFGSVEQQYKMLEVVKEVWKNSNFHFPIFVEKVWNIKLIELETILSWLFNRISQLKQTDNSYPYWETLDVLISKQLAKSVEIKEKMRYFQKKKQEQQIQVLIPALKLIRKEETDMFVSIFEKLGHLLSNHYGNLEQQIGLISLNKMRQYIRRHKNDMRSYFEKVILTMEEIPSKGKEFDTIITGVRRLETGKMR